MPRNEEKHFREKTRVPLSSKNYVLVRPDRGIPIFTSPPHLRRTHPPTDPRDRFAGRSASPAEIETTVLSHFLAASVRRKRFERDRSCGVSRIWRRLMAAAERLALSRGRHGRGALVGGSGRFEGCGSRTAFLVEFCCPPHRPRASPRRRPTSCRRRSTLSGRRCSRSPRPRPTAVLTGRTPRPQACPEPPVAARRLTRPTTSAPGVPGAAAPAARSVAPAALADRLRAARPGVHPGPRVTTAEPGRRARAASTFLR